MLPIPHFSEEEETMSQTGREMTDEEMRAMGLTPPQDEVDEQVESEHMEQEESEEGDEDADQYFQKYGVTKPPPCPKQMPTQGGRTQRPPEPPGPPPGYMAPAAKPAGLKPEPQPAAKPGPKRVPKPKPAAQVPEPKLLQCQSHQSQLVQLSFHHQLQV